MSKQPRFRVGFDYPFQCDWRAQEHGTLIVDRYCAFVGGRAIAVAHTKTDAEELVKLLNLAWDLVGD